MQKHLCSQTRTLAIGCTASYFLAVCVRYAVLSNRSAPQLCILLVLTTPPHLYVCRGEARDASSPSVADVRLEQCRMLRRLCRPMNKKGSPLVFVHQSIKTPEQSGDCRHCEPRAALASYGAFEVFASLFCVVVVPLEP